MSGLNKQLAIDKRIVLNFTQLKEGDVFELLGSGKIFTKWAGLIVAPNMESCEWIKTNFGADFFNKYVIRVLYVSSFKTTNIQKK